MKKKTQKPQKRAKAKPQSTAKTPDPGRRQFLSRSGKMMLGLAVLGGGGALAFGAVRATAREQDLSRVGQGVPTVVQIHDPSCAICNALQKETRKALKGVDPQTLDYVVANVKTEEGRAFADLHRQPHVTLILLDPQGEAVQILNGPQTSDDLRVVFDAHAKAYR